jgi:CRISPR/Cas system-associated protein Cas10 (large subunit of type III CRISPR-Cas system)
MKFDGNDAGLFFKSKTFSEYIDKSFWVDYSVKKAFYTALSNLLLREGIDDDLIARILAGVIFIGGDEGVIFAPSGLIIPFAIKFLKEAEKSLLKFKSGIIVAKPEHPVQMLFDAVNELMEKSKIKVNGSSLTSIGIIVTPSFITEQSLARELEQHKQILDVKMRLEDIQRILALTKPDYVKFTLNNKFLDFIRELESALEEYFTHNNDVLHIVAYLMRERIKVNQEKKENAEALSDFILEVLKTFRKDGQEYGINLLGFYNVVKAFKVGLRES